MKTPEAEEVTTWRNVLKISEIRVGQILPSIGGPRIAKRERKITFVGCNPKKKIHLSS